MYLIVDHREIVVNGYAARFRSEGVSAFGFAPAEFDEWLRCAADTDIASIEAVLLGDRPDRESVPAMIRERTPAPIIALTETGDLDKTLQLFAAGVDDVVRKPVHVREILARLAAMKRRSVAPEGQEATVGDIQVFFDGRDPMVLGEVFPLPRRERRILEYLIQNRGRRVDRTQIFNAVYGLFNEDIDATVIESHISKLRKKLRTALGADPISSKRYLGYAIEDISGAVAAHDDRAALTGTGA